VDNCQSVSANFVFFELFKAVERVEKLQRRRPHAGEEDAEEGIARWRKMLKKRSPWCKK
jgi:hypothetical protein